MSTGEETEVLLDLPVYGFLIASALFLSLAGNYLLTFWLVGRSHIKLVMDRKRED